MQLLLLLLQAIRQALGLVMQLLLQGLLGILGILGILGAAEQKTRALWPYGFLCRFLNSSIAGKDFSYPGNRLI